jgi:hypothetical protein
MAHFSASAIACPPVTSISAATEWIVRGNFGLVFDALGEDDDICAVRRRALGMVSPMRRVAQR